DPTHTGNGFMDSSEAGTPSDGARQRVLAVLRKTTRPGTWLLPALAINPNSSDPALFGGVYSSRAIETGGRSPGSWEAGTPSDRGRQRVLAENRATTRPGARMPLPARWINPSSSDPGPVFSDVCCWCGGLTGRLLHCPFRQEDRRNVGQGDEHGDGQEHHRVRVRQVMHDVMDEIRRQCLWTHRGARNGHAALGRFVMKRGEFVGPRTRLGFG